MEFLKNIEENKKSDNGTGIIQSSIFIYKDSNKNSEDIGKIEKEQKVLLNS